VTGKATTEKKGGDEMNLMRWQPFSDVVTLRQAMDRWAEDSFAGAPHVTGLFGEGTGMPVDMYQTDDNVVIKASVPGIKAEEVDITISGDTLSIKGETRTEQEVKKENYFRQERSYGAFSRSIVLPRSLQTDKADATFENGVLTITIPKAEEIKPKQIKIKGVIEGEKA
jgi:HSP20 family protein